MLIAKKLKWGMLCTVGVASVLFSVLPGIAQTVCLQPQQITLTRARGNTGESKTAIVRYPRVSGLTNAALRSRVQQAIDLKAVLGTSLEEIKKEFQESWWLDDISYEVNLNQNNILSITYTIQGTGAYSSGYQRHANVNAKTGKPLHARDLFRPEALSRVTTLVNRALQTDVQQAIKRVEAAEEQDELRERLKDVRFKRADLNNFILTPRGITFYYEFGLPHVLKALEPRGTYAFSFANLKPYLRANGPLKALLR